VRHKSCIRHFVLMCHSSMFLYHSEITPSFFLLVSFGEFWQESYVGVWGHYGSRPLNEVSSFIINLLWWYKYFIYGRLFPICFYKELGFGGFVFVLQVSYFQYTHFRGICFLGWGKPTPPLLMLSSTLKSLSPIVGKMHLSFESLVVTNALSMNAFFMDIHHDTSFRSILEDVTSKTRIRSCSGKGARLWLIVKPSICFLHYTFYFHLNIAFSS